MAGDIGAKTTVEEFQGFDGTKLYFENTQVKNPKGAVIISHGYGEHCGRYGHVIAALGREGLNVYAYDHRGHGRSAGHRAFVNDFEDYLEDLDLVMVRVREREGERPLFLLGHSMGSVIAAAFAITRQPRLMGLILSGTTVQPTTVVPPIVQTLGRFIGMIAPKLPIMDLKLAPLIARDPKVVAAYLKDPLNYIGKILVRTGNENSDAGAMVMAQADQISCSLIMLHGTDDKIAAIAGARVVRLQIALDIDDVEQLHRGIADIDIVSCCVHGGREHERHLYVMPQESSDKSLTCHAEPSRVFWGIFPAEHKRTKGHCVVCLCVGKSLDHTRRKPKMR